MSGLPPSLAGVQTRLMVDVVGGLFVSEAKPVGGSGFPAANMMTVVP